MRLFHPFSLLLFQFLSYWDFPPFSQNLSILQNLQIHLRCISVHVYKLKFSLPSIFASNIHTANCSWNESMIQSQCQKRTDILRFTKYVKDVSSICDEYTPLSFHFYSSAPCRQKTLYEKSIFHFTRSHSCPWISFLLIIPFSVHCTLIPPSSYTQYRQYLRWKSYLVAGIVGCC